MFFFYDGLTARLRAAGDFIWPTALRLVLFWEFWEAGVKKYHGSNWFADIPWADWQKGFPAPFDSMSMELNWALVTWGELVLSALLLFGLFTRFAALSLIVVTGVATAAVHWPASWDSLAGLWEGYVISADGMGNYKLPLLFVVMLMPLVFHGGGAFSLDRVLVILTHRTDTLEDRTGDLQAAGLALVVPGLALVWVEPAWGGVLLGLGALALIMPQFMGNPLRRDY